MRLESGLRRRRYTLRRIGREPCFWSKHNESIRGRLQRVYEQFRDGDLLAVAALLEYMLEQRKIRGSLDGIVASWKRSCDEGGPGTIMFKLSEIDADPSQRQTLEAALQFIEGTLEATWGGEHSPGCAESPSPPPWGIPTVSHVEDD